jgi:hypothetical protein
MSTTTTTNGTPSSHRMTGIVASFCRNKISGLNVLARNMFHDHGRRQTSQRRITSKLEKTFVKLEAQVVPGFYVLSDS